MHLTLKAYGTRFARASPFHRTPAKWPRETLITKVKATFAFCEEALAQLDDAKLADQITMNAGGTQRSITRAQMVLGHVTDMVDHYSQIANYMRLNNIVPPSALPRPARP